MCVFVMFRITYHNQFHRGSQTSWLEMLLKVPDASLLNCALAQHTHDFVHAAVLVSQLVWLAEVEKAFSHFKVQHGLTARSPDYESRYKDFIQSQFPELWSSYRHFEATRLVYNVLTRFSCLHDLKVIAQRACDFLHAELTHDAVIFTMKEVLAGCNCFFNAMTDQEQRAFIIEVISACVPWLECSLFRSCARCVCVCEDVSVPCTLMCVCASLCTARLRYH